MNLYFTYEARYAITSFTVRINVKTIPKPNPEHSDKFEIKISIKLVVVVHVLQTAQNLVISRSCLAEDGKRNVQRIITYTHSHWSAHYFLFGD